MQQTGFSVSNVIYARRIASRLQAKRYLNRPYVRATDEYRANIQRISIRKTSVCSRRVRKAREHTDVFSPAATRDNKKCCGNRRRTAATACGQLTRILGRAIRIFRTGQQRRSLTATHDCFSSRWTRGNRQARSPQRFPPPQPCEQPGDAS
ncbi:hypothetical protein BISA_0187 [Bifidobacterium saguini DSM 23967]|uniref:Uncharacterized protein n=1 Tax=Bifidobacterium saguini DSM 23967 TaxID=1437607 RepID=A0A087DF49_9BIFI|nr:hypothetical protein BISA_0187 [Bifidobacterium saguini DSM 23967]